MNKNQILDDIWIRSHLTGRGHRGKRSKQLLDKTGFDYKVTQIGYVNHEKKRYRNNSILDQWVEAGFITITGKQIKGKSPDKRVFAANGLIVPLKDIDDNICNFYCITSLQNHYDYLYEHTGLYPKYPSHKTNILILTDNIESAAVFGYTNIISETIEILSLDKNKQLTQEHTTVIENLPRLKQVVLGLPKDLPHTDYLISEIKKINPDLIINTMEVDDDKSLYELWKEKGNKEIEKLFYDLQIVAHPTIDIPETRSGLNIISPELITYEEQGLKITVTGGINTDIRDFNRLRLSLKVEQLCGKEYRIITREQLESLHTERVNMFVKKIQNILSVPIPDLKDIFNRFINEVEKYFTGNIQIERKITDTKLSKDRYNNAVNVLSRPDLMDHLYQQLTKAGVIGERNNAIILFLTLISRFLNQPLTMICTSTKPGNAEIMNVIGEVTSNEDLNEVDSMSWNTLTVTTSDYLNNKVYLSHDLKNVKKSMWAFESLLSRKRISKDTVRRNNMGHMEPLSLKVNGNIAFIGYTGSKKDIPRKIIDQSLLLQLDESPEQERLQLIHESKLFSGKFHKDLKVIQELKDIQAVLKKNPITIINPYSDYLIPDEGMENRRMIFTQLLKLIQVITFFHQFRLKKQENRLTGEIYIETTPEHIKQALELLKPVILNNTDPLTSRQRIFYEQCKEYCVKNETATFTNKNIQDSFDYPNRKIVNDYIKALRCKGYLDITEKNQKEGDEYSILSNDTNSNRTKDYIESLLTRCDELQSVTVTLKPLSTEGLRSV
jgi:hypothetical protein